MEPARADPVLIRIFPTEPRPTSVLGSRGVLSSRPVRAPFLGLASIFFLALLAVIPASATEVPRPAGDPLPEGNAYVRGLVSKQKRREEALNRYTYDVEQLAEELNAQGAVLSRKVERFEVFYVKGRPIRKRVAEDGRPLSRGEQEAEERRVREAVSDLTTDRAALEDRALRLSAILERYAFRTVAREDLDGWPALVLEFEARPGKRELEGDVVLRALGGRIWVDETEGEVVRAEVRNTGEIKLALGVGASVSALELTLDFRKIEDGLWMPARVEGKAAARVLLVKGFRGRTTTIFSHYRRFEAASEEEILPPQ